jgi:hypothetical protein
MPIHVHVRMFSLHLMLHDLQLLAFGQGGQLLGGPRSTHQHHVSCFPTGSGSTVGTYKFVVLFCSTVFCRLGGMPFRRMSDICDI